MYTVPYNIIVISYRGGCRRLFASITYATIVCCVGGRRNEQFNLFVVDFLSAPPQYHEHRRRVGGTAVNRNRRDCTHSLRDVYYNNNIGAHVANHLRRLDCSYYRCSRFNNNYHHYYSSNATRNKRTTTSFVIVRFAVKIIAILL